jgi:hypothetical protein
VAKLIPTDEFRHLWKEITSQALMSMGMEMLKSFTTDIMPEGL